MLDRIAAFLSGRDRDTSDDTSFDEKQVAAAALLVEAAMLDGHFDQAERETIGGLLRRHFGLRDAEIEALLQEAGERTERSEVHRFTRAVMDRFSHDERIELIEMLWEVAYADGVLHDYEANLLRRVGGLIYVTERDRGEARKRVMARLGLA